MILYLDTSAFLKLYLEQPRSDAVRRAVARAAAVYAHLIAYAEMRAALARAVRMGRMPDPDLPYQVDRFEDDWLGVTVIKVDETLVRRAGYLADRFGLRGYDSVHLAAAERIHENVPRGDGFMFGAFDTSLCTAAQALDMSTLR